MENNKLTQILTLKKYLEKSQKNGAFTIAEAANINNILSELISYNNNDNIINVYFKQIKNILLPNFSTPVHFITYSNDKFKIAKSRLLKEAENFNEFSSVKGYEPNDLPEKFKSDFKHILNQPRGGGYWIWKWAIINERLSEINDGEFLWYIDAGCTLNIYGKKRLYEYINILNNSKYGILKFQMTNTVENLYTVKELFNYFNISPTSNIGTDNQCVGGIILIKKNNHSINIFNKYKEVLDTNPLLFTDYYNKTNQLPDFIDNRHDQSVFSLITKIYGSEKIISDETWFKQFGSSESLNYPIWAIRSNI